MKESIDSYLEQIFKDRHYCPTCRAMTPAKGLDHHPDDDAVYYCGICDYRYDRELPVLSWMMVNQYHKHS